MRTRREPAGKKKRAGTGGTGVSPECRPAFGPVSSELQVTRRNLPHWQLGGASYFVTFRVKQGRLSEQERRLVLAACLHWHERKWRLYAVVVMPDHVHLLVQPLPRGKNKWHALGAILHSVKSYAAHQIQKRRKRVGSIWLDESFDRIVRNDAEFREKLLYMAHNPIKEGLARAEGEYPYFWCG